MKNTLHLNPIQVRDALNNAGMPDIALKVFTQEDIEDLSKADIQRIKGQIENFDNYYRQGWKESETRKHLLSLVA